MFQKPRDTLGFKPVIEYSFSKLDLFDPRGPVNLEILGLWNSYRSLATVQHKLRESPFRIDATISVLFTVIHCYKEHGESSPHTYQLYSKATDARFERLLAIGDAQLSSHIQAKAKVIRSFTGR